MVVKKYNDYDLSGEFGIGYTTNSNDIFYFDLEDYDKIKDIAWYCNNKDGRKYMENKSDKSYSIHRLIMEAIKGEYVDHKNRNTLDNRKENLRICTNQQNGFNSGIKKNNTSGIIGVCWCSSKKRWIATIKVNYKSIYLKSSKYKEEAIKARLKAEKRYFGEFAPQQHLYEEYGIEDDKNEK